jgi:5'-3' exoribonuclease 1
LFLVADGYINESGTINTRRLQVVLDEMALWEKEIFEKEYADMNWYKGKQTKHVKEMEMARKRSKLGEYQVSLPSGILLMRRR